MKNKCLILLLTFLFAVGSIVAQNQPGCSVHISTDFSSDCLLDEYPERLSSLLEPGSDDCMVACKGNAVVYTAVCSGGVRYTWNISGAESYSLSEQDTKATVIWGSGDMGSISVTVVTSDSNTCSDEVCVFLTDPPEPDFISVPAYYIDEFGRKVIEICRGETIYFTDMSRAERTPITGYGWNSCFGDAATQNYTLTPTSGGEYPLHHYVWNACGCQNEEIITLMIGQEAHLGLSCHGTVCENTTATYTVNRPSCSNYHWSVEGGTFTGQETSTITVQWGSPPSGYGVISLDSYFCDSGCQSLFTEKIPIIVDHAEIRGPGQVCVGDIQQYELPLWGSTWYQWRVLPVNDTGVVAHEAEYPNQFMPEFRQPGTYTIQATYACDFLECGPFTTQRTLVVKDTMSIRSRDSVLCKGDTGHYSTWHGNNVTWRVYRKGVHNSQLQHTSTSPGLDYGFATPGNYRVVASNNTYCQDAEFFVTVLDNPPALTAVQGPDEACPNSSILLSATPTRSNYYLQWDPLCPTATPASVEGDEVTINYGAEVCGVAVYQVDDEYGCRSEAYIHTVDTFRLAPHGLPAVTHACAGSTVFFSVPAQPGHVTYEWILSPANAATVIGDHFSPSVQILTNHLQNFTSPTVVSVTLKRTYCSNLELYETVLLSIEDVEAPVVAYDDTVCVNTRDCFTATTGTLNDRHYRWVFDSSDVVSGHRSTCYRFSTPGIHTFTLSYHPDSHCDAATVSGQVWVAWRPYSQISVSHDTLTVASLPNVVYSWEFNGVPIPGLHDTICIATDTGTYTCVFTSTVPPYCSDNAVHSNVVGENHPDTCLDLHLSYALTSCTEAVMWADNPPDTIIEWRLPSPDNPLHLNPSDSVTFHTIFPETHDIDAFCVDSGQCYRGRLEITTDCAPALKVKYDCNGHLIVKDTSRYRNGFAMPTRTIIIEGTGLTATLTGTNRTASIPVATLTPGEYTVTMDMGMAVPCNASAIFTYRENPSISGIDIRRKMCAGTPFLFTATTTGNIVRHRWNFGDGSYNFGNSIYHTYPNAQNEMAITLTVTDVWGCTATDTAHVQVGNDNLNGRLNIDGVAVCPGQFRTISYTGHTIHNFYYWNHDTVFIQSPQYNTTATGDYSVLVETDDYGCRAENRCNVGFLNEPVARIHGNSEYCLGEYVRLKGHTGNLNAYRWDIWGAESHTFTTPNIKFKPSTSGNYSVSLRVTSPDGCVKTAAYQFAVHPQPSAPTIALTGCIHKEPIAARCTSGQSLLWSNGFHGTTAGYYEDGYLSAYYLDAVTGCPSERAYAYIEPAPNYEALLTGCYEICPDSLGCQLPVYGFYPYHASQMNWHWYYDGLGEIAYGTSLSPNLPLVDYGEYQMETEYGDNCVYKSPELVLEPRELCPCEKIELTVEDVQCYVENCRMYVHLSYDVANFGSDPVEFDDLQVLMDNNVLNEMGLPLYVPANGSDFLEFDVELSDPASSLVEFLLIDSQTGCEKRYSQQLGLEDCIDTDCDLIEPVFSFLPDISTPHHTSCFQFYFKVYNADDVMSVWSIPSQIINYNTYTNNYPLIITDGLLMLNYGLLTQMAENREVFCLHAIVCFDGVRLCHAWYCIPAIELLNGISNPFRQLDDSISADNDTTRGLKFRTEEMQTSVKPYLAPNPTHDEVAVMGIAPGEVTEITLLTMQGDRVAVFRNDYRFNVSRLAKASYIVRVRTTGGKVYYLKLVKQ